MSKKQPINHSNSIIIRSRHTRGIQSQGICESELNANWHRHFGFGSVTTWQLCQSYSKQVYYSQAQKTIFDDLIFKFSFDDTAEKLMINWYEEKWQNFCFMMIILPCICKGGISKRNNATKVASCQQQCFDQIEFLLICLK